MTFWMWWPCAHCEDRDPRSPVQNDQKDLRQHDLTNVFPETEPAEKRPIRKFELFVSFRFIYVHRILYKKKKKKILINISPPAHVFLKWLINNCDIFFFRIGYHSVIFSNCNTPKNKHSTKPILNVLQSLHFHFNLAKLAHMVLQKEVKEIKERQKVHRLH